MNALGRGCLELIVAWALAGLGLHQLLKDRFTEPGPFWGAIVGGFLTAGAWGLLRNSFQARSQANMIRSALLGEWPRDGAAFAAVGTAVALEQPLVTPFRRRPCVLYSYELSKTERVTVRGSKGSRTETRRTVYMSGLAMASWAVRCPAGDVRVMGFSIPDQFPEDKLPASAFGSAIRSFVAETEFTEVGKWEVGKMFRHAAGLFREGDGEHRDDLKFSEAELVLSDSRMLAACDLTEQYIPVDAPVCALGRFDTSSNGLVNDLKYGGLQVIPGDGESGLRTLVARSRSYLIFAIVLALLGTVGNFGLLSLRERSFDQTTRSDPVLDAALLAAWESGDLAAVESALQKGASPDVVDVQGTRILLNTTTREMFDLLVHYGASLDATDQVDRPPLLAAIDRRNESLAWMLLNAGADVRIPQTGWNRTALESAFDRNLKELFTALQERQAPGLLVTREAGRKITDEKPELENLLTMYSACQQEGDRRTLESISDNWPTDYLESVERRLYADTRPLQWNIEEGYRDDSVATVVAVGPKATGATERYVVTFILRNGEWKIRRVHWDEYYAFEF